MSTRAIVFGNSGLHHSTKLISLLIYREMISKSVHCMKRERRMSSSDDSKKSLPGAILGLAFGVFFGWLFIHISPNLGPNESMTINGHSTTPVDQALLTIAAEVAMMKVLSIFFENWDCRFLNVHAKQFADAAGVAMAAASAVTVSIRGY